MNAAYAYDPLGRRTHKSGAGVTERYFLNDGDDEVVEYDGSKNPVAFYVPGPAIDEPVVMAAPNGSGYTHEYFHTNHQGSVIAMSDDNGGLAEGPFLYDAYGNCFKGSTACGSLANTVPYKFTGRRLDPETGLYYYRARCYSPTLGRFCQTDPVGYTADLNLYTYVGNDPTNRTDPKGLFGGEPEDPVEDAIDIGCAISPACRVAVGGTIGAGISTIGSIGGQLLSSGHIDAFQTKVDVATGTLVGAVSGYDPTHAVAYAGVGEAISATLVEAGKGGISQEKATEIILRAILAAGGTKLGDKLAEGLIPKASYYAKQALGAVTSQTVTTAGGRVVQKGVPAANRAASRAQSQIENKAKQHVCTGSRIPVSGGTPCSDF